MSNLGIGRAESEWSSGSGSNEMPRVPSEKEIRYDRQLRLWGDHGQLSLENAHVCLLNATAVGTEMLKSLVLSGVGAFTIIDGQMVAAEDAGNNFFLDNGSMGESRAKAACRFLRELNPEVRGYSVQESPAKLR